MVNALTSLASENNTYYFNKQGARGQYVPIPGRYVYMSGLEWDYQLVRISVDGVVRSGIH